MYADWPDGILKYEKFRAEHGPGGDLVFRGPRCGGGGSEGRPSSLSGPEARDCRILSNPQESPRP